MKKFQKPCMKSGFPLPPKTLETALIKVQAVEDAWNTRDSERVAAVVRHRTHLQSLVNTRLFNLGWASYLSPSIKLHSTR